MLPGLTVLVAATLADPSSFTPYFTNEGSKMWHIPMGQTSVLAVGCHTCMNSYSRPLVLDRSLAPLPALRIELACSVLVLFPFAVIRHHDKGCIRQKGLLWLTIPVHSPSLQGGQKQESDTAVTPHRQSRAESSELTDMSLCSA